jgi:translation initiation factor RLI1
MYNLYIMQTPQTFARTQIYLTQAQQAGLAAASSRAAVSKSELIRLAIDHLLDQEASSCSTGKTQRFASLAGLWADHDAMADPAAYVQALRQPRF